MHWHNGRYQPNVPILPICCYGKCRQLALSLYPNAAVNVTLLTLTLIPNFSRFFANNTPIAIENKHTTNDFKFCILLHDTCVMQIFFLFFFDNVIGLYKLGLHNNKTDADSEFHYYKTVACFM